MAELSVIPATYTVSNLTRTEMNIIYAALCHVMDQVERVEVGWTKAEIESLLSVFRAH